MTRDVPGEPRPSDPFSWQPALTRARARLEAAGVGPDDAERLSRGIVVSCARQWQPASSEEAARLALEEAETLALGLAAGAARRGLFPTPTCDIDAPQPEVRNLT